MKRYVIIGGGAAAVGCIEGIRSVDREGKIALVAKEGCTPYFRPMISYYLQGKTDFEKMKYRHDGFYTENKCEVLFSSAKEIDAEKKNVTLEQGTVLSYDALCIAVGSSPFVPPFVGLESVKNAHRFMTKSDALALEKAVTAESDVLIVGAGLIGLKCAEGLCGKAKSITVCDLAPRVLSSILDDTCASMMQKRLEAHGISFLLSDSVQRFSPASALMKSGKQVRFNVLVLAVGVRANLSPIKEAGAECERGILIDTSMRTSLDGIFAAGDCTQGYDLSTDSRRVVAILPNAFLQGHCAGVNMAGQSEVLDTSFPMNAIGFFGFHALTAGSYDGALYEECSSDSVKRLYVRDGRLVGFILVGEAVDRAGIYTALIRDRVPLEALDFELMKKSPSLAAFSSEYRRKKLGGVV